jgi:hypothetical protein
MKGVRASLPVILLEEESVPQACECLNIVGSEAATNGGKKTME